MILEDQRNGYAGLVSRKKPNQTKDDAKQQQDDEEAAHQRVQSLGDAWSAAVGDRNRSLAIVPGQGQGASNRMSSDGVDDVVLRALRKRPAIALDSFPPSARNCQEMMILTVVSHDALLC